MFCVLFEPQANILSFEQYQTMFTKLQNKQEGTIINNVHVKYQNISTLIERFRNNYIYMVNKNDNNSIGVSQIYLYAKITNGPFAFIGVMFNMHQPNICNIMCKSEDYSLMNFIIHALKFMLVSDY